MPSLRSTIASTALLLMTFAGQALSQTTEADPPKAIPPAKSVSSQDELKPILLRESLLGIDEDRDGIRDDIEAHVADNPKSLSDMPGTEKSDKERTLESLGKREATRQQPRRRSCLDYMVMSPEDQSKVDRRLRTQSNGMFGTHPCDPVVSPLLERRFETDFLQLDLGPVVLRY